MITEPRASATSVDQRLVVSVRGLRARYGSGPLVLDGVDFELARGELVALVGSSGSGKSTLMRCLTGFAPITGGSARVGDHELAGIRRPQLRRLRARVGQVFQQFNLVGRLSVLTNVLTGALPDAGVINLVGGFSSRQRIQALDLLDRVGIADKAAAPARTLSGGQQQRVAIARALMQQPDVILADEPVASLDPAMADTVLTLLREIAHREGIAVLVSLHVVSLALQHSDRVVALQLGRVIMSAPTAGLDPARLTAVYDDAEVNQNQGRDGDHDGHHRD